MCSFSYVFVYSVVSILIYVNQGDSWLAETIAAAKEDYSRILVESLNFKCHYESACVCVYIETLYVTIYTLWI